MESTSLTLYDIEQNFLDMVETEGAVSPEQAEGFAVSLADSLKLAVDKRDRAIGFLRNNQLSIAACEEEIARLRTRKERLQKQNERFEAYVVKVLESIPEDRKGVRKLPANLGTLTLRKNPDSVIVKDEQAIPSRFKTLTIKVQADDWEEHVGYHQHLRSVYRNGSISMEGIPEASILSSIEKAEVSIRKDELKKALQAGEIVEGADLAIDNHSLKIT